MTTVRVQALVLVFSFCLFATNAATTETPGNQSSVTNAAENADTTTEPLSTTVATTSVATTTVAMTTQPDKNTQEEDNSRIETGTEPLKPFTLEPKKTPSPQYLLYEVEKGIRGLTLKDIEYILDIGNGEDVVSLALADKLGYLPDGDDSDPHVKIIEDNQEQLVSELKHKREEFENVNKHTLPPTTPPPPATTTEEDKRGLMEYGIVKRIDHLSVAQISDVLYYTESIPAALGDALGFEFGKDDSYLEYIGDQGAEKWRDVLLETIERKLKYEKEHPTTVPPQDIGNNEEESLLHGKNLPPGVDETPEVDDDPRPMFESIDGPEDAKDLTEDETPNVTKSLVPGLPDNQPNSAKKEENSETTIPGGKKDLPNSSAGGGNGEGKANEEDPDFNSGGVDDDVDSSLDIDDDYLSDDTEETRSSFGAWHFLTIFIFIGVAVVVGYVCVHNRKKLREGVGTYISDANKRRRRAREYKPLMNT